RWCIQYASATGERGEPLRLRKLDLYGELSTRFGDQPWMVDVLRELSNETKSGVFSIEDVEQVCMHVESQSKSADVRAAAGYYAGLALVASKDAHEVARGEALLEKVAAELPSTDGGARARQRLFQLRNLQIGKTAPDFVATDVDGVDFKLSDYRGKVV